MHSREQFAQPGLNDDSETSGVLLEVAMDQSKEEEAEDVLKIFFSLQSTNTISARPNPGASRYQVVSFYFKMRR